MIHNVHLSVHSVSKWFFGWNPKIKAAITPQSQKHKVKQNAFFLFWTPLSVIIYFPRRGRVLPSGSDFGCCWTLRLPFYPWSDMVIGLNEVMKQRAGTASESLAHPWKLYLFEGQVSLTIEPRVAWNSPCMPDWYWTQRNLSLSPEWRE